MNENERKEIVYLALSDLYHEFSNSINHLLIIREFLQDLLNIKDGKDGKDGKDPIYEYPKTVNLK